MNEPDYQRVVNDITSRITSGELRPGEALESIVKLAARYETSQTTIKTAQALLRSQGWITGRQGKGVYIAQNPPRDGGGR